jgi:hypothetical protein
MKKLVALILLVRIGLSQTFAQSHEYVNNYYRFSAVIPDAWKLYGQILNDTIRHKAIADWSLPPIYSDIEKTEIENSVSITAYKKDNITTIDQLITAEYLRLDPTKYSMEVDSASKDARIIFASLNGLNYKGKSYFVFKNGIGYVINFMGTPGTFDKNLPTFEKFRTTIKFL